MATTRNGAEVSRAPVYDSGTAHELTGHHSDVLNLGHRGAFELSNGTIALSFSLDRLQGNQALISKDGNGDSAGQFTVSADNGWIVVTQEKNGSEEYLRVPDVVLEQYTEYHLAFSFGDKGIEIWLNGALVASEPTFKQGIDVNDKSLLVGGSRAWRSNDSDTPHSLMKGEVGNITIFDSQLGGSDMIALTGAVDPMLATHAQMQANMADLAPLFEQLHHGSDTLQDILHEYGVSHHGHMMSPLNMMIRGHGESDVSGTSGNDGINGQRGDDDLKGAGGDDVVQGGYGNDKLLGGNGNDILDGGHGEDVLRGGAGDDLLISRADAREGPVYLDPDRDEGDPYNELTDGKLYPDQPIPGDDALWGGSGADIFYFQTLINAKQRYIEKHTRDDGTINWHGVAGENDKIHDHWVDVLGNDAVMDFSRAEGDRIVVEGHTTEIDKITYGDANGDGVMDHSVIWLYSEQGSGGGAHADDRLGTITVYGDLITEADIEHDAGPAYGIVATSEDLDEAVKPTTNGTDTGNIKAPNTLPTADELGLPTGLDPVMAITGEHALSGDDADYMDVGHHDSLALKNGTIALSFELNELYGDQALISKDGDGRGAGQFTVWLKDGTIVVVQENGDNEYEWLKVPDVVLSANTTYHLAFSFGDKGIEVWLNGELAATEPTFKQGLELNDKSLVIGGTRAWRSDDSQATSELNGTVGNITIFDSQLGGSDMIALTGAVDPMLATHAQMQANMADLAPLFEQLHHGSDTLQDILHEYGVSHHGHMMSPLNMMIRGHGESDVSGTSGNDGINGQRGDDDLKGAGGDDVVQGGYGNDKLLGGNGNDILDGGHGEDVLRGGAGDDLLISRADAREGPVYLDPDRDEGDPYNELTDGKLYPDQPIPGDDALWGGSGADIFYFQTLINAKQRYIEKHTRDDGTINWHGVAGENDKIHDHWVDVLGNDAVMDFSRAEGDRIVVEGHTTEIDKITYGDANGDGVMDHSVIWLYSEQGSGGGAHADDRLGTITVYGDLITEADIEHDAGPAYGIVATSEDLDEAVKPTTNGTDTGNIKAPNTLPTADELGHRTNQTPVTAAEGDLIFDADARSAMIFEHSPDLNLKNGTIGFQFRIDDMQDWQALFSKDATGMDDPGHITAYVEGNGTLIVRVQDGEDSHYLRVDHLVQQGETYDFAMTFGRKGAELYINGAKVAYDEDVTVNWVHNDEAFVLGASGMRLDPGTTDGVGGYMDGVISDFAIYDRQLRGDQIFHDPDRDDFAYFDQSIWMHDFIRNVDGVVIGHEHMRNQTLGSEIEFVEFKNTTVRLDDIQFGTRRDDTLYGGDGADVLLGRIGNDKLVGQDNDDYLAGEDGDDELHGGDGRDALYGDAGEDRLFGGNGIDLLKGGIADDDLYGGAGNDKLYGGLGDDLIFGDNWNSSGTANNDRAFFDGNLEDYTFVTERYYDSNREADVSRLVVTDAADGGADGLYEGRDRLLDIDFVVFADQTVAFDTLL